MTTATDFQNWTNRAKDMTDAELAFALKDAGESAETWRKADPIYSAKKCDELAAYVAEMLKRTRRAA